MSEKLYLPHSTGCFVCGENNPCGLKLKSYVMDNRVCSDLNFADHFNSYINVTHGGILSTIMDEAMGWAGFIFSDSEVFLFTRELTVRYKKNVPTGTPLLLSTEFVSNERGGMISTKGQITDMDNNVLTVAKGLFFPVSKEKMIETKSYLIFDDNLKYHPKALKYCK